MNKSDSERLTKVIEEMGFVWTENEEEADLLGLVACSVRQKAIDKVYTRIHKWNKRKSKQNLITFVSGCVLPADRKKFMKLFDLIFQMSELTQLPAMLSQYGVSTPFKLQLNEELTLPDIKEVDTVKVNFTTLRFDNKISITGQPVLMKKPDERMESFWNINPTHNSDFEAYIPIQNGCNKFCTYCAVPYTRGREISRPSSEIIAEVRKLVENGYKSITLLGQNVNSYGLDKNGEEISFANLLREIGKMGEEIKNEFWVYFTSPHPQDMTNDVIDAVSEYKCLAKQIHLPMQSGDDHVLIHMKRNHSINDFRKIVTYIRHKIPEATLFTDVIVGFTGETEEQFQNSTNALIEFNFNMAYIAQYSPRPGATSSRWIDDIPKPVKKQRLFDLTAVLAKQSLKYNQSLIGKEIKILVVHKDRKGGYLSGITEGRILVRFSTDDDSLIGKFVSVKIKSAINFATEGDLVKVFQEDKVGI
jgi:tRNA-2-methylthio-N6-dimethylallyladenosine synthase